MKKIYRFISLVLVIAIMISSIPVIAAPEADQTEVISTTSGGDETASGVIEIDNAKELQLIGTDANYPLNGNYVLVSDINIEDKETNGGLGEGKLFKPIGDEANPFTGTFDGMDSTGKCHVISHLNVDTTSYENQNNAGLFGCISGGGTVKNVGIEDGSVRGANNVGGIVGSLSEGTVENCYYLGSVSGTEYVGGAVGCSGGQKTDSTSGEVSTTISVIKNCYQIGTVEGVKNVGGIAGQIYGVSGNTTKLENCYHTGKIKCTDATAKVNDSLGNYMYFGGLIGCYYSEGGIGKYYFSDCYYNRQNSGNATLAIGAATDGSSEIISFELDDDDFSNEIGKKLSVKGLNTDEMTGPHALDHMSGFVETIYMEYIPIYVAPTMSTYGGVNYYPQLRSFIPSGRENDLSQFPIEDMSGDDENPDEKPTPDEPVSGVIEINDETELQKIGKDASYPLDGEYILVSDLNMEGIDFEPIGNSNHPFTGIFNGNSKTISGLHIDVTGLLANKDYIGLFGVVSEGGIVKNLGVENSTVKTGGNNVGGIVGWVSEGTIENCYYKGSVSGSECVGGVVGCCGQVGAFSGIATVKNCYQIGSVEGNNNVGGIVGKTCSVYGVYTIVENCYHTGVITCVNNCGGLVGCYYNDGGVGSFSFLNSYYNSQDSGDVTKSIGNVTDGGKEITDFELGDADFSSELGTKSSFKGLNRVQMTGSDALDNMTGMVDSTGNNVYIAPPEETGIAGYSYYPQLSIFVADPNNANEFPSVYYEEDDIPEESIPISSAEDLQKIGNIEGYSLDRSYHLVNNISMSGVDFKSIGDETSPFVGTLDGQGYVITGYNGSNGLFKYIGEGGTVKNLGIEGIITGSDQDGDNIGGIAGSISKGTIENCYFKGSITGSNYVGGVAGYSLSSSILNSYHIGTITAKKYAGGMVGKLVSFNELKSNMNGCYHSGYINCKDVSKCGGLIGFLDCSFDQAELTNCYYDKENNGVASYAIGGDSSGTSKEGYDKEDARFMGLTTQQMTGPDVFNVVAITTDNAETERAYIAAPQQIDGESNYYYPQHSIFVDGAKTLDEYNALSEEEQKEYLAQFPSDPCANAIGIYNESEFQKIGQDDLYPLSANYILFADMNMGHINDFKPIGAKKSPFTGSLNGNGHVISNLKIDVGDGQDYIGLFGYIESGTVKNLGVNGSVVGGNYVGGVAGYISEGAIIENCYFNGDISGKTSVGGVVGCNNLATVVNCYQIGSILGTKNVGGVVGEVISKYSTETGEGPEYKDDVIATVEGCYHTGRISCEDVSLCGGLVGCYKGDAEGCSFKNSYYDNKGSGDANLNGELGNAIGFAEGSVVHGDYDEWNFKGLSTEQMTGPDAANCMIGLMDGTENSSYIAPSEKFDGLYYYYPQLSFFVQDSTDISEFPKVSVSILGAMIPIYSAVDLKKIGNKNYPTYTLDAEYILMNDINMNLVSDFKPIGYENGRSFSGTFNGNGHEIYNLNVNIEDGTKVGLFRSVKSGTIKNLGVRGSVSGSYYVGGLAGTISDGSIIENCYFIGGVYGKTSIGGLVGQVEQEDDGLAKLSKIINSYHVGTIFGETEAGGITGSLVIHNIDECYPTMQNCYHSGYMQVKDYDLCGGIIGVYYNFANVEAILKNSYYNKDSNGDVKWAIGSNGSNNCIDYDDERNFKGLSTEQMTGPEALTTMTGMYDDKLQKDAYIAPPQQKDGSDYYYPQLSIFVDDSLEGDEYLEQFPKDHSQNGISIYNVSDLKKIGNDPKYDLDYNYVLANDIDLKDEKFEPIGDDGDPFTGTFNGNRHTIYGLNVNAGDYAGLFGCVEDGMVKNVKVEGIVTGKTYVGGIVGWLAHDSYIENCCFIGNVTGDENVGGIVGYQGDLGVYGIEEINTMGGNAFIRNCYHIGGIAGSENVGGIAGKVVNAYYDGKEGKDPEMGNCYHTGAIYGEKDYGGLIGYFYNSKITENDGDKTDCNLYDSFYDNQNCGMVGANKAIGGCTGKDSDSSYTDATKGDHPEWNFMGLETKQMTGLEAFKIKEDDSKTNDINEEKTVPASEIGYISAPEQTTTDENGNIVYYYPQLNLFINAEKTLEEYNALSEEEQKAYLSQFPSDPVNNKICIYTASQLKAVGNSDLTLGVDYILMNDIKLDENEEFNPIGSDKHPFTGTFDGNRHVIYGLNVNTGDYAGLFGCIENGVVKNVKVEGTVTGETYVGGVVGWLARNSYIENCAFIGNIFGEDEVGGIAGRQGDLGTKYGATGGNAFIRNCYHVGGIAGTDCVGGISGKVANAYYDGKEGKNPEMGNCYHTGAIQYDSYGGGLIGYFYNSKITENDGDKTDCNLYNSFYDNQNSGMVGANKAIGGCTGKDSNSSYTDATEGDHSEWNFMGLTTEEMTGPEAFCIKPKNDTQIEDTDKVILFEPTELIPSNPTSDDSTTDDKIIDIDKMGYVAPPEQTATDGNGNILYYYPQLSVFINDEKTLEEYSALSEEEQKAYLSQFPSDPVNNKISIRTASQLKAVGNSEGTLGADYILINDIELNENEEFKPIGSYKHSFTGTFDGNGHTIYGLLVDEGGSDEVGLFGAVDDHGWVANLRVIGSVFGGNNTGGIVGWLGNDSEIKNCCFIGNVYGDDATGGVVGWSGDKGATAHDGNARIIGCYHVGGIVGSDDVGGVVGKVFNSWYDNCKPTVKYCYHSGYIHHSGKNCGGLIGFYENWEYKDDGNAYHDTYDPKTGKGRIDHEFKNSYYDKESSGVTKALGGIEGYNHMGDFGGEARTEADPADMPRHNFMGLTTEQMTGSEALSSMIGMVDENGNSLYVAAPVQTNQIDGGEASEDITDEAEELKPDEAKKETGMDNESEDEIVIDESTDDTSDDVYYYPQLSIFINEITLDDYKALSEEEQKAYLSQFPINTSEKAIPVRNARELQAIGYSQGTLSANYILMNDIDMTGVEFEPIGTEGEDFNGRFNGNSFVISNLNIDKPDSDYVGLFGCAGSGAIIKDLGVTGNIKGRNYVGGIVGWLSDGNSLSNSFFIGDVSGKKHVGGLVGKSGTDPGKGETIRWCVSGAFLALEIIITVLGIVLDVTGAGTAISMAIKQFFGKMWTAIKAFFGQFDSFGDAMKKLKIVIKELPDKIKTKLDKIDLNVNKGDGKLSEVEKKIVGNMTLQDLNKIIDSELDASGKIDELTERVNHIIATFNNVEIKDLDGKDLNFITEEDLRNLKVEDLIKFMRGVEEKNESVDIFYKYLWIKKFKELNNGSQNQNSVILNLRDKKYNVMIKYIKENHQDYYNDIEYDVDLQIKNFREKFQKNYNDLLNDKINDKIAKELGYNSIEEAKSELVEATIDLIKKNEVKFPKIESRLNKSLVGKINNKIDNLSDSDIDVNNMTMDDIIDFTNKKIKQNESEIETVNTKMKELNDKHINDPEGYSTDQLNTDITKLTTLKENLKNENEQLTNALNKLNENEDALKKQLDDELRKIKQQSKRDVLSEINKTDKSELSKKVKKIVKQKKDTIIKNINDGNFDDLDPKVMAYFKDKLGTQESKNKIKDAMEEAREREIKNISDNPDDVRKVGEKAAQTKIDELDAEYKQKVDEINNKTKKDYNITEQEFNEIDGAEDIDDTRLEKAKRAEIDQLTKDYERKKKNESKKAAEEAIKKEINRRLDDAMNSAAKECAKQICKDGIDTDEIFKIVETLIEEEIEKEIIDEIDKRVQTRTKMVILKNAFNKMINDKMTEINEDLNGKSIHLKYNQIQEDIITPLKEKEKQIIINHYSNESVPYYIDKKMTTHLKKLNVIDKIIDNMISGKMPDKADLFYNKVLLKMLNKYFKKNGYKIVTEDGQEVDLVEFSIANQLSKFMVQKIKTQSENTGIPLTPKKQTFVNNYGQYVIQISQTQKVQEFTNKINKDQYFKNMLDKLDTDLEITKKLKDIPPEKLVEEMSEFLKQYNFVNGDDVYIKLFQTWIQKPENTQLFYRELEETVTEIAGATIEKYIITKFDTPENFFKALLNKKDKDTTLENIFNSISLNMRSLYRDKSTDELEELVDKQIKEEIKSLYLKTLPLEQELDDINKNIIRLEKERDKLTEILAKKENHTQNEIDAAQIRHDEIVGELKILLDRKQKLNERLEFCIKEAEMLSKINLDEIKTADKTNKNNNEKLKLLDRFRYNNMYISMLIDAETRDKLMSGDVISYSEFVQNFDATKNSIYNFFIASSVFKDMRASLIKTHAAEIIDNEEFQKALDKAVDIYIWNKIKTDSNFDELRKKLIDNNQDKAAALDNLKREIEAKKLKYNEMKDELKVLWQNNEKVKKARDNMDTIMNRIERELVVKKVDEIFKSMHENGEYPIAEKLAENTMQKLVKKFKDWFAHLYTKIYLALTSVNLVAFIIAAAIPEYKYMLWFGASSIKNCYHIGTVSGNDDVGGLAGEVESSESVTYKMRVENSYHSGSINCKSRGDCGGLVGYYDGRENHVICTNSYYDYDNSGDAGVYNSIGSNSDYMSGDIDDFKGMSMEQMTGPDALDENTMNLNVTTDKNGNNISTEYFTAPSAQTDDEGYYYYPQLTTFVKDSSDVNQFPSAQGCGSTVTFTPISTVEQFMEIDDTEEGMSGNYMLMNDITFTAEDNFEPIGKNYTKTYNTDNGFSGTFIGNGHTIDIGDVDGNSKTLYLGLFSQISGGKVYDLNVEGNVEGAYCVGILAGRILNGSIVDGCSIEGNVKEGEYVGGVTGELSNKSQMTYCSHIGAVEAGDECGGGLIGNMTAEEGTPRLKGCYNAGPVYTSYTSTSGALVGNFDGYFEDAVFSNNYYDYENVGDLRYNKAIGNKGDCEGLYGLTTAEMTGPDAFENMPGVASKYTEPPISSVDGISYYPQLKTTVENSENADEFPSVENVGQTNVIEIDSADELLNIGKDSAYPLNGKYVLTCNIDFGGRTIEPIGSEKNAFTGSFDGRGYTISNVYINTDSSSFWTDVGDFFGADNGNDYAGFFAKIEDTGCVINTIWENINVKGDQHVGLVTGYMENGARIEDCQITGESSIKADDDVGGLTGELIDESTIKSCSVDCEIEADERVGGTAGYATDSFILDSNHEGLTIGHNDVGGMVGKFKIRNEVTSSLKGCYTSGYIGANESKNTGALVGYMRDEGYFQKHDISDTDFRGSYYNSDNYGNSDGGAIGDDSGYDGDSNGGDKKGYNFKGLAVEKMSGQKALAIRGMTELSTEFIAAPIQSNKIESEMVKAEVNETGAVETKVVESETVKTNDEEIYYLPQNQEFISDSSNLDEFIEADGENVIYIYTPEDLQLIASSTDRLGLDYKLMNDLDLTNCDFVPIGTDGESYSAFNDIIDIEGGDFSGTFDGNGHTIKVDVNRSDEDNVGGVFGCVGSGGSVKNLKVEGNVVGDDTVGGIVGWLSDDATIENCCFVGNVTGDENVGGIAGYQGDLGPKGGNSDIKNCYHVGAIFGREDVGGITGEVAIQYWSAESDRDYTEMSNCYHTGYISAEKDYGGLIGYISSDWDSTDNYTFKNSYYDTNNSGIANKAIGGVEKGVTTVTGKILGIDKDGGDLKKSNFKGLTTEEMTGSNALANMPGFNEEIEVEVTDEEGNTSTAKKSLYVAPSEQTATDENGNPLNYYPQLRMFVTDESDITQFPSSLGGNKIGISTAEDLSFINSNEVTLRSSYVLMNDIDLTGVEFTPIGTSGNDFNGTFDGNGYNIYNLNVIDENHSYKGLFGCVGSGGTVKNVGVEGYVKGNDYVGGLVGWLSDDATIENCYFIGDVSGHYHIGGLVGCSGDKGVNGGNSDIISCYHLGKVKGTGNVGGIVGHVVNGYNDDHGEPTVENCYHTGYIEGEKDYGGLVGYFENTEIMGDNGGYGSDCDFINSYYNKETSCVTGAVGGTRGKTYSSIESGDQPSTNFIGLITDQMTGPDALNNMTGMKGYTAASIKKDESGLYYYPQLSSFVTDANDATQFPSIDNIKGIPIYTGDELKKIGHDSAYPLTSSYTLMNDIDLRGVDFEPIGTTGWRYEGTFYGEGHVIYNLNVSGGDYQGLFGCVGSGGEIKDLGVQGTVSGSDSVGGVAGWLSDGSTIENCYFIGGVTGNKNVGGLVGYSGDKGITGGNSDIITCYHVGKVKGSENVGGIAGKVVNGYNDDHGEPTVENCYHTGYIEGEKDYGGLVGYFENTEIMGDNGGYGSDCDFINSYYNKETSCVTGAVGGTRGKTYSSIESGDQPNTNFIGLITDQMTGPDALNNMTGMSGYIPAPRDKNESGYYYYPQLSIFVTNKNDYKQFPYSSNIKGIPIYSEQNLRKIGHDSAYPLNGTYTLMNDITMSSENFTPIGTEGTPFTGKFYGEGHVISNLKVDVGDNSDYAGLFAHIQNGIVKDLGIDGYVKGADYVGGLVAWLGKNATVENCYFTGEVYGYDKDTGAFDDGDSENVGGLVGYSGDKGVNGGSADIINCYTVCKITGTEDVGGIVGQVVKNGDAPRVESCYHAGEISCDDKDSCGGVIGYFGEKKFSAGSFKNCYYDNQNSGNANQNDYKKGNAIGYDSKCVDKKGSGDFDNFKGLTSAQMTGLDALNNMTSMQAYIASPNDSGYPQLAVFV